MRSIPAFAAVVLALSVDAASGQATGKRMHKPFTFTKEWDRKMTLADGRVFVLNSQTGEVRFGDGLHGGRPEAGAVPPDGTYRSGGGAAGNVSVRGGKLVTLPKPTPRFVR